MAEIVRRFLIKNLKLKRLVSFDKLDNMISTCRMITPVAPCQRFGSTKLGRNFGLHLCNIMIIIFFEFRELEMSGSSKISLN